jgi:hypothetical protein
MDDYSIALVSIKEPLTSPTVFDVTPKDGATGVPIDSMPVKLYLTLL